MEELKVYLTEFGGKLNDEDFDNGPAMQRAIDFLHKRGGGEILPECGHVHLHSSIYVPEDVHLHGFSFYTHLKAENKGFEITCLNCSSRRALIHYDELYDRYHFECTDCGNYGEEVDWFEDEKSG